MSQPAIKLYRHPLSGHAHRVELLLSLLKLPTELVFVDLANGAHKQAAFLAINAFGQVPAIDDNGTILSDSNAILVYLAKKYGGGSWLADEPLAAARVQRWLSVAAGQLAYGPASARLITVFGATLDAED
ncbi:glutathione S-transferase, partial [Pseudomonas sp. CrR25]|nr:glutathione S-transferase [Pseudomonas sp. CrR25]